MNTLYAPNLTPKGTLSTVLRGLQEELRRNRALPWRGAAFGRSGPRGTVQVPETRRRPATTEALSIIPRWG